MKKLNQIIIIFYICFSQMVSAQVPEYKFHPCYAIQYSHAIGMMTESSINGSTTISVYSSVWESNQNYEKQISSDTFLIRCCDRAISVCGFPPSPMSHDAHSEFVMDKYGNLISCKTINDILDVDNVILGFLPALTNLSFPIPRTFNQDNAWKVSQRISKTLPYEAIIEYKIHKPDRLIEKGNLFSSIKITSPHSQSLKINGHGAIIFSLEKGIIIDKSIAFTTSGNVHGPGSETIPLKSVFWSHTSLIK